MQFRSAHTIPDIYDLVENEKKRIKKNALAGIAEEIDNGETYCIRYTEETKQCFHMCDPIYNAKRIETNLEIWKSIVQVGVDLANGEDRVNYLKMYFNRGEKAGFTRCIGEIRRKRKKRSRKQWRRS